MSRRVLEVRFRSQQERWQYRLFPDSAEQVGLDWKDWTCPEPPQFRRQLMASLFETEASRVLLQKPWDLRLRPETFGAGSSGIPEAPWSDLTHPTHRLHLFEAGWTITQVLEPPQAASTSGQVSVLGSPALLQALVLTNGPDVLKTGPNELLPRSIVVVDCVMSDEEADALDNHAWERNCPLIIWCKSEPRRPIAPCVIKRAELSEKFESWLSHFLRLVLLGRDPVHAFAEVRRPKEERAALAMYGAFESWTVSDSGSGFRLPRHWYISLDRSNQESHLNLLVEGLLDEQGQRRIQVVLVPGPVGSGLEWFRQRPLRNTGAFKLIEWDVGWADNPAATIRRLMQRVRADDEHALPYRLQEEAAACPGGRALFFVRHATISFEEEDHAEQLTLEELASYLRALEQLAPLLATSQLRLLVYVSVLGATTEQLASFERDSPHFMCDALNELGAGVPLDELKHWLRARNVRLTEDELKQWASYSYDQLVAAIVNRSPRLMQK